MNKPIALFYPDLAEDDELTLPARDFRAFSPIDWAVHYIRQDVMEREEILTAFNISDVDIQEHHEREYSEDVWPCLEVALRDAVITIVYRNSDGTDVDYFLTPQRDVQRPILIGTGGGEYALPALSWSEIQRVAGEAPSADEQAQIVALLSPACWDSQEDTRAVVAAALLLIGAQGDVTQLASHLAAGDVRWYQVNDTAVCDSPYSVRNPSVQHRLGDADLAAVSQALR